MSALQAVKASPIQVHPVKAKENIETNKSVENIAAQAIAKATLSSSKKPLPYISQIKEATLVKQDTLKLADGSIVQYSKSIVGKGGFKTVYAGTRTKTDGTVSPVAVSSPHPCPQGFSTFSLNISEQKTNHCTGAKVVKLATKGGSYQLITISDLCTNENTHYAGNSVNDALYFKNPISNTTPHNRADKNYSRILYGLVKGVREYYSLLHAQGLYKGRHGDIKPSNFVFDNNKKQHLPTPYSTLKLIDLPEDPEGIVNVTPGFFGKGLNRHARDIHALRTMFIMALHFSLHHPMIEGDQDSPTVLMQPQERSALRAKVQQLFTMNQYAPTSSKQVKQKEENIKLLIRELNTQLTAFITQKNFRQKTGWHGHILITLFNSIVKLNLSVRLVQRSSFGKKSQKTAIFCMDKFLQFIKKDLGESGPTGSPMKPLPVPATAAASAERGSSKRKLSPKKLLPPTKKKPSNNSSS
ncbi:hypothetical protein COB21_02245 [Candidatus Aerophobetes bacterium]|uniref:Protein kinase domain-containing protein n=1 Tax=Aerophobetes bacterium TaxID=2030807 RepID=A0A2A4X783_UNCAE|nr:MAG: hypothetical protein COB21_02245 [Candidatus Aerophobetes bacterium]